MRTPEQRLEAANALTQQELAWRIQVAITSVGKPQDDSTAVLMEAAARFMALTTGHRPKEMPATGYSPEVPQ